MTLFDASPASEEPSPDAAIVVVCDVSAAPADVKTHAALGSGMAVATLFSWVVEMDRPDGENTGTLSPLVRLLTDHEDESIALAAKQVKNLIDGRYLGPNSLMSYKDYYTAVYRSGAFLYKGDARAVRVTLKYEM